MAGNNINNEINVLTNQKTELLGSKANRKIISGLESDSEPEEEMEVSNDEQFQMVESRKEKKNKRSRVELDSSVEEDWGDALVQGDVIISEIRSIEERIRRMCVGDPAKKVSQKLTANIMSQVVEISKKVESLVMRNAYLKGVIDCKDKEIARITRRLEESKREEVPDNRVTYSTAMGQGTDRGNKIPPLSGIRKKIPTLAQVAIISPPEGSEKNVEETKKDVMALINPANEKIRIKGVRKRADGKISIETATAEDLGKIIEHENLKKNGFVAVKSGAWNPKVVLYDVPREMEPNEVTKGIFGMNGVIFEGMDFNTFNEGFIPRFRIGRKDGPTANWVIEVTANIRNILRSEEKKKVYLEWRSCKVEDYKGVTRCYKCQTYGHISKFCQEETQVCSYCSKSGHKQLDCPDKKANKSPTCASCKKARKKSDHSINDKACPAYKAALERIIERTDYGLS